MPWCFVTWGATAGQIRAAWLVEFGAIGTAAGLIAASAGTLASWAVMRFVMEAPWSFLPLTLAATVLGCIGLMLIAGYAGTAAARCACGPHVCCATNKSFRRPLTLG